MKILLILVALTSIVFGLDINKASAKELEGLNGIGVKKAQAIIEYRIKYKCFKTLDELRNVKGIGDSIIEKNKNLATLSPCNK